MKILKIKDVLSKGYQILKENDIESYIIDCQLLLQSVINKDKIYLIINMNEEIDNNSFKKFMSLVELRKKNMPVKYILGKCEFMGIDFIINEGVLIPRPDTEILVEEVLKIIDNEKLIKISDVGCGSGAIGISLGHYNKNIEVDCYDISSYALENTKENIKLNNMQDRINVIYSDLLSTAISKKLSYDLIVSNPPYIKNEDINTLMKDVKDYEPYTALAGGMDGLDFYRDITKQAVCALRPGGYICYEIGYDQMESVSKILKKSNFEIIKRVKDLSGHDRVIIGKGNFL